MSSPVLNGWKEIAAFLKVHEQTAMKLANEQGLPVVRAGGIVLTSSNAIEAWIIINGNPNKKDNSV